jgi:hypothetical protein
VICRKNVHHSHVKDAHEAFMTLMDNVLRPDGEEAYPFAWGLSCEHLNVHPFRSLVLSVAEKHQRGDRN